MKSVIRNLVSLALVICLSMSVLVLSACNNNIGNNGESSSSIFVPPTMEDIKFEDRANYNAKGVEAKALELTVYHVMYAPDAKSKVLKDYLLGDVYNMLLDQVKLMMGQTDNLSKINLDIFYFRLDTTGQWRNYNKSEVHPILNRLLNLHIDGSQSLLILTDSELKTYGEIKLYDIFRQSVANTKVVVDGYTVNEGNQSLTDTLNKVLDGMFIKTYIPLFSETLNASIADFAKLLDSSAKTQAAAFNKIYGDVKLGDIAAVFGKTLPTGLCNFKLSQVLAKIENVKIVGLENLIQTNFMQQIEAVKQKFMATTMGNLMLNFGIELPNNLASYTVGQVISEIQAMNKPAQKDPTVSAEEPAEPLEPVAPAEPTEPVKTFFGELQEYVMAYTVYTSTDGAVTLTGSELYTHVMGIVQIIASQYEGNTAAKIEAMVTALNNYVVANDEKFTALATAMQADGKVFTVNQQTMLPTELYLAVKGFLAKGESYQSLMVALDGVTIEGHLKALGYQLSTTDVEKVDKFVKKYMGLTIAELIDSTTFVKEYSELQGSLTLKEQMLLIGGANLENNTAFKAFMAKYGDMTSAELATVDSVQLKQDMVALLKGLKLKELLK